MGAGELVVLLGCNGIGKSTTLRLLAGLLKPQSGSIRIAGLDSMKGGAELRRRVGVLPDGLALFEELSMEEQLELIGRTHGLDVATCQARMSDLAQLLDFEEMRWVAARKLSQGTRKKLALAMALLPDPQVLLLDEPFEAVDPSTSRRMEQLFQALAARGRTILFSAHDLALVERLAPRILLLGPGGKILETSIHDLDWRDFVESAPAFSVPHWFGTLS